MTANPLNDGVPPKQRRKVSPEEMCDLGNAHLAEIGRTDVAWEIRKGEAVLDWTVRPHISGHHLKHPMDRRGEPMSAEDTRILNYCLEKAGATARYLPDGSRYTIDTQAAA